MSKRVNANLAKIHRSYFVSEVAETIGVHKNTVRVWIKDGLPICDNAYPILILGRDLREYLRAKQNNNKRPCKANEMYCLKCRAPKEPMGNMVDYHPKTATRGQLTALCSSCESIINRFTTLDKANELSTVFEVSIGGTNNT